MTDEIYAHEHPETDRKREGGFTLWFTGLSGSGKTTIAHLVGPAISPYAEARRHARELVEEFGPFVEVFVDVSIEEATRRDTKGLYARALNGEIQNFTGVNDPYERPERPAI